MMVDSENQGDDAKFAEDLLQLGTNRHRLSADDLNESSQFGSLSVSAKVENYARRLQKQIEGERDRLLDDKRIADAECDRLRSRERELISLKSCLIRDRWETLVSVCAMALAGALTSDVNGKPFGFALIVIATAWQAGKVLWVTVVDWKYPER
ncbi:hypothetical protein [Schlesneria sp.]|uniref:hypothetical protein n=1 Tax=Schlesneria sp. TaxID=2762018 RepID=UPI002F12098D